MENQGMEKKGGEQKEEQKRSKVKIFRRIS